jgi:mannonate dehydratase
MPSALNRRHALCCAGALAAGLFTTLLPRSADAFGNPCRGALPPDLARHDLVLSAFDGLDSARLIDVHAHLLGNGDAGSGCTVNASASQWWHPVEVLRRRTIMNAACVPPDAPSVDRAYVQRLQALASDFPAGARWWLFAFDQACDDRGRPRPDLSTFHVPNGYAAEVAAASPRFEWVASVHPYREDAQERLDAALRDGAVAVKWLPSAMNIDLADPRCRVFYDRLAASGKPLIVHCGEEKAVPGAGRDSFGNPLRVRHALERGVSVVVAHLASLGRAADIDRPSAPSRPAFELLARLLDETSSSDRGRGRLLADISAVFQINRDATVWRRVIERDDWHGRLLNGSDYPLPGVLPLVSPARLVNAGLLDAAAVEPLLRIREHNPLLFDFVLKRQLRSGTQRLPAAVFEARALPATVHGA